MSTTQQSHKRFQSPDGLLRTASAAITGVGRRIAWAVMRPHAPQMTPDDGGRPSRQIAPTIYNIQRYTPAQSIPVFADLSTYVGRRNFARQRRAACDISQTCILRPRSKRKVPQDNSKYKTLIDDHK